MTYSQIFNCIMARCRNCSAVIVRLIFVCWLFSAGVVFAEGKYQTTRDEKTTVWNADPKPGDEASWNGSRDSDGYAKGFGTITWSNGDKVYGRYFGHMVRGKFDGAVNVHSQGQTAHATFAEGKRTSRWVTGPAPSRIAAAKKNETRSQQIAKIETPPKERVRDAEKARTPVKELEAPAEGPQKTKENVQPAVAVDSHPPEQSATPINREQAPKVQRPTTEPPAEGPVVAKTEIENIESNRLASNETQVTSSPLKPTPSATESRPRKDSQPDKPPSETPRQGLVGLEKSNETKEASEKSVPKSTTPDNPKGGGDDIRSLVRPPSSLRAPAASDVSSDGSALPSVPGSDSDPKTQELIKSGDAEARKAGYNLDEYRRPRAQHDALDDIWWLIYERKPGLEGPTDREDFYIAIDGKTKKITIVREE